MLGGATAKTPFYVLIPGASQSPAHYAHLIHLLLLAGYPVHTSTLPSVGNSAQVTAQDDADYVLKHFLLPVLDVEERDVIMLMHSYSSVPGSAVAKGLSKSERAKEGKKTGVIGQVYLASLLVKGGDGTTVVGAFGGGYPPHIRADEPANLLRCDDRVPALYGDLSTESGFASTVAISAMGQGITSFNSPIPRATWDSEEYKGRIAFIRTLNDMAIPVQVQQMMIDGTGVDWILKDIESSHSPQLSKAEELAGLLVELAKTFEKA